MATLAKPPASVDRSGPQLGVHNDGGQQRATQDGDSIHEKVKDHGDESSEALDDAAEAERRDREVLELARKYSTQSGAHENLYEAAGRNSVLDPFSANFSAQAWTKALLELETQEPEKFKPRSAGFAFKDLNVYGFGTSSDFQRSVGNVWLGIYGVVNKLIGRGQHRIEILQHLDGFVEAGEMLVVLGPPGSGCSTFLKTIAGETHGFFIDKKSELNYQGITAEHMQKDFRGEAIYTAEVDVHFPMLTVGQTLSFAAQARAPRHIPGGVSREIYAQFARDAIMASFGITHTLDTPVGNDFVRGVSGGERKRVTIAEAALSNAPLQCWDNSTRGLDSANAIEFIKTVRMTTNIRNVTAAVAIYQSPQSAYDVFDKVLVLYEGRQIFFGRCDKARDYFIRLGFEFPERSTDADFLTSMTSPLERKVREGVEGAPYTPDEFAAAWKKSEEYTLLRQQIDEYNEKYPIGGESLETFKQSRRLQQAKVQRVKSPYTLSYTGQIALCLKRGFWRLRSDPTITFVQLISNSIVALIISSVFYNLQATTSSFFQRAALLFFAILLNAFGSALEILTLYAQRPIIEKHARYAFYHPSCEAFASMLTDLPYKITNAITFNLVLYFMTHLRREPGAFFFFILISFVLTLTMSMFFRSIASFSRSLSEAMAPAAILILGIVTYTGFAIPVPNMRGWARWIQYINPVSYGFESLMINEFYGREFECSTFIPGAQLPQYANVDAMSRVCSAVGAQPGSSTVSGTAYIEQSYQYVHSHKWRNLGILIVFMIGLCALYVSATELISAKKSKGEVLVFRRGHAALKDRGKDEETGSERKEVVQKVKTDASAIIQKQTAIFHWQDVCYVIKVKGGERRLLDGIDGWVKPGTLTALMGVSGAGKTTLLDVLATRKTVGVISGEMLVDGLQRDESFQRKTGYVQQQDLHLSTTTVREALNFSALLRQPAKVPRKEKLDYVNDVIKLLDMEEYADAVVGVPGEGLNVEQRKRLTIGVELAAKPELLLFLDEPTSGLDSQTSWAICDLLERLKENGQAILCTIHQPSALLFQRFDRLLFLAAGGKQVYFGEIGHGSEHLITYFEGNGAISCPPDGNPAEWILDAIGASPGSHSDVNWPEVWKNSPQRAEVLQHLAELKEELPQVTNHAPRQGDKASYREFAAPFGVQFWEVQKRVFEQYWRTPSYIYSKASLCLFSSLFIGFSFFNAGTSQQELQNQMFSIFLLFTIFGQLAQQIMPHFVTQRDLYEARERPSKTYSWKAFMLSNIFVELPWNTLMGAIIFVCFYFPVGMYRNAEPTNEVSIRSGLMFLLVLNFLLFTSTFTSMVVAAADSAESAGNIANLMFSLTLIFCGVLASPTQFPHFWIFMYRLSPFTYLVSAMLSTGLANNKVVCSTTELLSFKAPSGNTCGNYMKAWTDALGGYVTNDTFDSTNCKFCALSETNTFLKSVNANYATRWRDYGILWAFILFNIAAALFLYWIVRVPKSAAKKEKKASKKQAAQGVVREKKSKGKKSRSSRKEKGEKSEKVEQETDAHDHPNGNGALKVESSEKSAAPTA